MAIGRGSWTSVTRFYFLPLHCGQPDPFLTSSVQIKTSGSKRRSGAPSIGAGLGLGLGHTAGAPHAKAPAPAPTHAPTHTPDEPPPAGTGRTSLATAAPRDSTLLTTSVMKLHSVPTIVLHFHGFELSSLSTMHEQITSIVKEVTHKAATLVALYGGCVVVTYAVKVMMSVMLNAVVSGAITFATYSSLLVLTTPPALPFAAHSSTAPACERCASRCKTERLPLLSARELVPSAGLYLVPGERPSKKEDEDVLSSSSFRTSGQLPAVRRRLMARMRQGPPIVNVVRGETRRRADMALSDAKIRVGKAYMETNRATGKQTDVYMVRVDCGTSGDEKHMNPVVMWDVSATFDEFKRLESDLKKEIKHKRLRNLRVPHLSTGAVLFVQPELTQHVLNARRQRLQTFLDEIRTDKVMADLDAMRRFCQAF